MKKYYNRLPKMAGPPQYFTIRPQKSQNPLILLSNPPPLFFAIFNKFVCTYFMKYVCSLDCGTHPIILTSPTPK